MIVGPFLQVMGRIVRECQRVHDVHVDHLSLHANALRANFGRLGFVLRELQESCMMELLVDKEHPMPVANTLLRLIEDSVKLLMRTLCFALAVPTDGGGRWVQQHRLKGELTILDGERGLIEKVKTSGGSGGIVHIGKGRRIICLEAIKIFELWLPSGGELSWYDVFISYSSKAQFDRELADALFDRLGNQAVGTRALRVFLDKKRLQHGRNCRRDVVKALGMSTIAIVVMSWAGIRQMQGVLSHSEVNEELLLWTIIVELLATGRLKRCLPIVLAQVRSESGAAGHHAASVHKDDLEIRLLAPAVCTKVVEAAVVELQNLGCRPSDALFTRTVRETAEELLRWKGEAYAALGSDLDCHGAVEWEKDIYICSSNKALACIDETMLDKVCRAFAVSLHFVDSSSNWLQNVILSKWQGS